jgi:acylphosphatase
MTRCVRFLVSGRVQGVGFRAATSRQAQAAGIRGWVRNLPDGRVEVIAAAEQEQLEGFAAWLRRGPPGALVSSVEELVVGDAGLPERFGIR